MGSFQEKVFEFHLKNGFAVECSVDLWWADRQEIFLEEVREMYVAVEKKDKVALADALGDLVYVLYGHAVAAGVDLDAVLEEIHKSNMTKTSAPGVNKALKGDEYVAPDIAAIVGVDWR